jgi:arginine deiminase
VIWVKRAKEEHDAFCGVMRDRGVDVLYAEQLLTDVLGVPEARGWVLDRVLDERHVAVYLARSGHECGWSAAAKDVADFLIGGITKRDLAEGEGLTYESADLSDMLLPPLPNFLFQRDRSSWIYDGVTLNPMAKRARRPGTVFMEAIYRWHPMFVAAGGVRTWHGGVEQDWGAATVEGGDIMPIGDRAVMIGMGKRTAPQAVTMIARELFNVGSARVVFAVMLPRSRHYMHLDTVMTLVDRDTVTLVLERQVNRPALTRSVAARPLERAPFRFARARPRRSFQTGNLRRGRRMRHRPRSRWPKTGRSSLRRAGRGTTRRGRPRREA